MKGREGEGRSGREFFCLFLGYQLIMVQSFHFFHEKKKKKVFTVFRCKGGKEREKSIF
jgi:hypothetical protein